MLRQDETSGTAPDERIVMPTDASVAHAVSAQHELPSVAGEDESQHTSSRPPSPPQTGTHTPRLSIMPCPARFTSVVPPFNYGAVQSHTIYRSAFPQDRNLEFLRGLHIRTVLALVDTEPSAAYEQWIDEFGISRRRVNIAPNKEGKVQTTLVSMCDAVLIAMNPANHPIYIHCNQGRHRTGCVVACVRKAQKFPLKLILKEYETYADPKMRTGDVELITKFDPHALLAYARDPTSICMEDFPALQRARVDSGLDIFDVVGECLP